MATETVFELQVLIKRIADFKESNDLTLQEIAEATGVQKSYVHKLLKLDAHPSLKYLLTLSRYMKSPLFSMFIPTDNEIKIEFIKRANEKISELNYSLEELSEVTNINYLKLTDILTGNTSPGNIEILALDQILNVSRDYIYVSEEAIDNIHASILRNKGLNEEQIETIQNYIKSLKK